MTSTSTSSTHAALGDYVLTLACPDQPGIVHAVTSFLLEHGGNIRESQQFGDREHGRFFMRIGFETAGNETGTTPTRSAPRSRRRPRSSR